MEDEKEEKEAKTARQKRVAQMEVIYERREYILFQKIKLFVENTR